MPADAKLVWITREQRDRLTFHADGFLKVVETFDAAPEPVERRRCVTHDAEEKQHDGPYCWLTSGDNDPEGACRFVTLFEVPAPSQPEPPDEATT